MKELEELDLEEQEKIYKKLAICETDFSNYEDMDIIGEEEISEDLPNVQTFKETILEINYPISEIKFKKKNTIQALVFAQAKTQ
jgi:hypothetical protein